MFGAAIGLGIGLAGSIGKMFGRGKANKQMSRLMGQNPQYKINPLAQERLGLAQTLLNARMPGAMNAERNIFSNQAGQISNINRVATDSSQALALATGTQGATNDAIMGLGQAEAMDYQRRYGNLSGAQDGMINEQDKVFQDQVRRFQDNVQIQGGINQNKQAGWGDISNMGFGLMDFGLAGGFGNMFGGGNTQGNNGHRTTRTTYIPPRN